MIDAIPRNTWYDFRGKTTPYAMFMEAQARAGASVPGIFASWIAKQSTCEYMLWNHVLEFHETGEVLHESTAYSKRGDELHNELAFGTVESPLDSFREGDVLLQWQSPATLRAYQQHRLDSVFGERITEYSLAGEIAGLQVRGTLDAFNLATGEVIEYKTRAKPSIAYLHERRNKIQVMTYHALLERYDVTVNHPGFPVGTLSPYIRVVYMFQDDGSLIGEQVIHVPYERDRFEKTMAFFREFWTGARKPAFSLKHCFQCRFKDACHFHVRFYKPARSKGTR